MKKRYMQQLLLGLVICVQISFAGTAKNLSLDLQGVDLPQAIRLLARFIHLSVIVSPQVVGLTSLHLQQVEPKDALDILLRAEGLAKTKVGHIWLIAPEEELIKRKETERQWQEKNEASAPLVTQLWEIKYANAEKIANLLTNGQTSFLTKRGRLQVDTRTNILCIQDVMANMEVIRRMVARLDVPVKQIAIKARLVSIDDDMERELGIHFVNAPRASQAKEIANQYSLAIITLADGSLLDVKLAALEKEGHAELISSPRLFTANQQTASIEAGEEVPYQEVSESGGTAIVFKKAVLGLTVTPQILPGDKVLLQMQINQDRPSNKMVLGMPTISTRQMKTSVITKAGQTVVLGGIYEVDRERGVKRVPFLAHIPFLGWLFTLQQQAVSKRELLIFVTPTISAEVR